MGETFVPNRQDDAPITTSKHSTSASDARDSLVEGKGVSLIGKTVTVNRPRAELFAYWRDFSNLPNFMESLVSVELIDDLRSRWVVKAPAGKTVEWIAVITQEQEGEFISWASEEGADIPNSGRINFSDAPGGRGTWVSATILYDPPGGIIGKVIATMFQREPAIQARRELRRFKQLMETGEVATGARTQKQLEEEKG